MRAGMKGEFFTNRYSSYTSEAVSEYTLDRIKPGMWPYSMHRIASQCSKQTQPLTSISIC
jgi:hypothetical protein